MKIRISENIRTLRKEKKMTQEQLSEALGVTVGAVSKWESGASTPDISMIVALASFFETSVDALLGYDWQAGSMGQTVEQIRSLRNEKRFDEATDVAERALQKYPNAFDIAFQAAVLFCTKGVELHSQKSYRRSLSLFERSLALISQNTNEKINEWTLRNNIAEVHLCLGQTQTALELLKKNNADGLNNASIGYTLAVAEHKPNEALPYLSDAMVKNSTDLFRIVCAFACAYSELKEYTSSRDIMLWMCDSIAGLKKDNSISYLDKEAVMLLASAASMDAYLGDAEAARLHLRQAKALAQDYDAAPSYGFSGMRTYYGESTETAFDEYGATAMDGIEKTISEDKEVEDFLLKIWNDLKEE